MEAIFFVALSAMFENIDSMENRNRANKQTYKDNIDNEILAYFLLILKYFVQK